MNFALAVITSAGSLLSQNTPSDSHLVTFYYSFIRHVRCVAIDLRVCARVAAAVRERPTVDKVEAIVGYRASINTARDGWRSLQVLHIEINELRASEWLNNSSEIILWALPGLREPSAIIGIYWTQDGTAKLFTGHFCRR